MAYWLFKSEPSAWSWDQQVAKGDEGEEWGGVRNYQAVSYTHLTLPTISSV